MASEKRSSSQLDPEYEDITEHQNKRQRRREQDAKDATVRKIESIVRDQFLQEMHYKEQEIDRIDQRLTQARQMLDRLRACVVATYYSKASGGNTSRVIGPSQYEAPSIHPAVKKFLGKAPAGRNTASSSEPPADGVDNRQKKITQAEATAKSAKEKLNSTAKDQHTPGTSQSTPADQGRSSRFKTKKRIVIGNVSKYIPVDKREGNDQATHKWMVYVRGSREEPNIESFVSKVWFFLHPSYKPNDLVEVSQPPFHLTRRGWGEFPLRCQLHFKDHRNKKVDIIHKLRLDKSYTGLQTLGGETVVDVELERESVDTSASTQLPHGKQRRTSDPSDPGTRKAKRHKRNSGLIEEAAIKKEAPSPGKASPALSDSSTVLSSQSRQISSTPEFQPAGSPLRSSTPLPSTDSSSRDAQVAPVTPSKTEGGWLHFQIKKEPTSPAPQIVPSPTARSMSSELERDSPVQRRTLGGASSRIGTVSPMTSLSSNSNSSDVQRLPSPATPNKDWTHVQIKSEPTSPVQPGGWQNLSSFSTPPKSQPSVTPPPVRLPEQPQLSSPVKPVSMNIGSIGSKANSTRTELPKPKLPTSTAATTTAVIAATPPEPLAVAKPPTVALAKPGMVIIQASQPVPTAGIRAPAATVGALLRANQTATSTVAMTARQTSTASPVSTVRQTLPTGTLIRPGQSPVATAGSLPRAAQLPGPMLGAPPRPGQTTVFVKCIDNQGKIYLIPQHLLTKSPASAVAATAGVTPPRLGVPVNPLIPALQGGTQLPLVSGSGTIMVHSSPVVSESSSSSPLLVSASPGSSLLRTPSPGTQTVIIQRPPEPGQRVGPRPVLLQLPGAPAPSQTSPLTSKKTRTVPRPLISPPGSVTVNPAVSTPALPPSTAGLAQLAAAASLLEAAPVPGSKPEKSTPTQTVSKAPDNLLLVSGGVPAGKPALVVVSQDGAAQQGSGKLSSILPQITGQSNTKPPAVSPQMSLAVGGKAAILPPQVAIAGPGKPGVVSLLSGTQFMSSKPAANITPIPPKLAPGLTLPTGSKATPQLIVLQPSLPTRTNVTLATTPVASQPVVRQANAGNVIMASQASSKPSARPYSLLVPQATNASPVLHIQPQTESLIKDAPVPTISSSAASSTTASTSEIRTVAKPAKRTILGSNAMQYHRDLKAAVRATQSEPPAPKTLFRKICASNYSSLEDLLHSVTRQHPLVGKNIDRSVHPYCASTAEQHLTWGIGKRRAAEWQRAFAVRRRVLELLGGQTEYLGRKVYTTKQLLHWCRQHGYSPLDNEMCRHLTRDIRPLQSSGIKMNSYSSSSALLQQLQESVNNQDRRCQLVEMEEDIDIISIESCDRSQVKTESPRKEQIQSEMLPLGEGVAFIKETSQQVGVCVRPVEPDPHESPGVFGCVVEEMIAASMKLFMENMLRKATAVIMQEKRIPEEITVGDVHKAIMCVDHLDFLTNSGLGVPQDEGVVAGKTNAQNPQTVPEF